MATKSGHGDSITLQGILCTNIHTGIFSITLLYLDNNVDNNGNYNPDKNECGVKSRAKNIADQLTTGQGEKH